MKNAEFTLTPMAAAGLFGAAPSVLWFAAGWILWTFIEYVVHRALHAAHSRAHFHHHAHPHDEPGAVFWPFWIALFAVVWWLPLSLTGGLVAGYAWFINVHHGCHFAPETVAPSMLAHHEAHHHASPNGNFAVSLKFWDWVFRTLA